jgi:hypothetical protein
LSKTEFNTQLLEWLAKTSEEIISPPDYTFGGTGWLYVEDGRQLFKLNRDTKRAGVVTYLKTVIRHGPELEWCVVASQRGNRTAVGFGPTKERVKGFYLYLESDTDR